MEMKLHDVDKILSPRQLQNSQKVTLKTLTGMSPHLSAKLYDHKTFDNMQRLTTSQGPVPSISYQTNNLKTTRADLLQRLRTILKFDKRNDYSPPPKKDAIRKSKIVDNIMDFKEYSINIQKTQSMENLSDSSLIHHNHYLSPKNVHQRTHRECTKSQPSTPKEGLKKKASIFEQGSGKFISTYRLLDRNVYVVNMGRQQILDKLEQRKKHYNMAPIIGNSSSYSLHHRRSNSAATINSEEVCSQFKDIYSECRLQTPYLTANLKSPISHSQGRITPKNTYTNTNTNMNYPPQHRKTLNAMSLQAHNFFLNKRESTFSTPLSPRSPKKAVEENKENIPIKVKQWGYFHKPKKEVPKSEEEIKPKKVKQWGYFHKPKPIIDINVRGSHSHSNSNSHTQVPSASVQPTDTLYFDPKIVNSRINSKCNNKRIIFRGNRSNSVSHTLKSTRLIDLNQKKIFKKIERKETSKVLSRFTLKRSKKNKQEK